VDPEGDPITFSLSGGADGTWFAIDPASGELTFSAVPDFENPADADADNVYEVLVSAGDGIGGSATQLIRVTVINVNEPPSITLPGGPVVYTEKDPPTVIDASATVVDPDSADFDTGVMVIDFASGGTLNDRLGIRNEGTGAGQVGVSGSAVTFGGTIIGTFFGGTSGSDPLVVSFNASAGQAAVQAVMRNITYHNVSPSPLPTTRLVGFALTDGDGGTSNFEMATITLTNDRLVNTTTAEQQRRAAVASDVVGNYVVVWESQLQDGSGWGIYARQFDANSNPLGGELLVNTTTVGDQFDPAVAMDASGNFVVTWSSQGQDGDAAGESNVYARMYDDAGTPLTPEWRVNETAAGDQQYSSVSFDGLGNLMVTWSSLDQDTDGWGVLARRFDDMGAPLTGEFQVNTTTAGDQMFSDVAGDAYGGYVVVWQSFAQDGSGWGVYGQLYDESGASLGSENRLNTTTSGDQHSAAVAMEDDGDYAVVWVSEGQDGSGAGVFADRFNYGDVLDNVGEFRVNTSTIGHQTSPDLSSGPAGDLIVTWTSTGQHGDGPAETNVYAQVYEGTNLGPAAQGGEQLINTFTAGSQQSPSVAADDEGDFAVAWSGNGPNDSDGVFARVFNGLLPDLSPRVSLADTPLDYIENDPPLVIDPGLTVSDPDDANLAGAIVRIRGGFAPGEDELLFADQLGITGSYDPLTGVLTLSGTAPVADYQTALRAVAYRNTSEHPDTTDRLIEISADDGVNSCGDGRWITVTSVNDVPSPHAGGPYTIDESNPVMLDASASSDLDGDPLAFSWDIDNNGSFGDATGVAPLLSWAQLDSFGLGNDGTYTISVQVDDGNGGVATASTTVTINNLLPTAADDSGAGFITDEDSMVTTGNVLSNDTDPNANDNLTVVAIDTSLTAGLVADNGDGTFGYSPDGQFEWLADGQQTTDTFVYTVDDGDGGQDTATVTIAIDGRNDAPLLNLQDFTIAENTPDTTVVGLLTANDPDTGDVVSYAIIGGNTNGAFAIDAASGQITVANSSALDFETIQQFDLIVESQDLLGLTDSGTVTIYLTNVNESPTAGDDTFSMAENSAIGTTVGTVSASDPDVGDVLTYSITGGDPGGAFAMNSATGEITVADSAILDFETLPTFNLTVRVQDLGGLADTATVTVNLTDVNEAPTVDGATFNLAENSADGTSVGTVTAGDPDGGDTLTYSITGGNTGGAFGIDSATGEITVANSGALDYETIPSFNLTVEARDNGGLADTAGVAINLTNVNEAPTANDATFGLLENSGVGTSVGMVAAGDPDVGDTLTYTITAGDPGGVFAIDNATGDIRVADDTALDYETTPVFNLTVQVRDAGGLIDTADITVSLSNVNEGPTADPALFNLAENSAAGTSVGSGSGSDPDAGDTLTYAIIGGNASGAFAIDSVSGEITVADATPLDFETTSSFNLTIQVQDGGGLTDSAGVIINLTDVNEPPAVGDAVFSVTENSPNGTSVGVVSAADPDTGDTLTYAITGGNTDGAFAIHATTGEITVANSGVLDHETNPTFNLTVLVQDAAGLNDSAAVTIHVTGINDGPTANDATFGLAENSASGTSVGTVVATDPDPADTLTYSIIGGNTGGAFTIDSGTGEIEVASSAALDYEMTPSFLLTVQVEDSSGLTDTAAITINLSDVNETPTALDAVFGLAEDSPLGTVVGTVAASDPDAGDTLSYTIRSGNLGGAFAIDGLTGEITVADSTALDFETTPVFVLTVEVQDSGGLADSADVTIHLSDANERPAVGDAVFNLAENSPLGTVVGTVSAADPDAGETLTFAITGGNASGTFAVVESTGDIVVADPAALDYEATAGFSLTVRVQDSGGLSDTATVSVNLTDVNEAPVAGGDVYGGDEDVPLAVAAADGLLQNDADEDGDALSAVLSTGPSHGQVHLADDGSFTYTPNADFDGTDRFVYRASDGTLQSSSTTVVISLTPVNDAPVSANDSYRVETDQSATVHAVHGVLANDWDVDGDVLTVQLVREPLHGTLTLNSDGSFTFVPEAGFSGDDGFSYRATDGTVTSDEATVAIAVEAPAQGGFIPVAENDGLETQESANLAPASDEAMDVVTPIAAAPTAEASEIVAAGGNRLVRVILGETDDSEAAQPPSLRLELADQSMTFDEALYVRHDGASDQETAPRASNEPETTVPSDTTSTGWEYLTAEMREDLDQLRGRLSFSFDLPPWIAGTALVTTTGLTAGYVLWTIRGGYLLASLLTTMPAWTIVDPLPVLEFPPDTDGPTRRRGKVGSEGAETLESIINNGPRA
jgi:VCBS repeat-containing protein